MKKLPDWLLLITTPPVLASLWIIEDIRILRILAFIWGINVVWDALGWVSGIVIFRSDQTSS